MRKATIAFPDAEDVRTLEAALYLEQNSIARSLLVGSEQRIRALAAKHNITLDGIEIHNPSTHNNTQDFAQTFFDMRAAKGISKEQALTTVSQPLYYAGLLLRAGQCSAVVAGSLSTTGDVLRTGIQTVGLDARVKTVSSFFLMILGERVLAYADCGVVPYPSAEQLADIAYSTAQNYASIVEQDPRIAFLSFSTQGSADHESVSKVQQAVQHFSTMNTSYIFDGELQADAALVPTVAQRKAPHSPLGGNANVLVFPNLDAGNIAYKLTERLAGATALGPIVQGLAKPYCDLSRGCNSNDIILVSCISALMS